jgi:hypothetical protein
MEPLIVYGAKDTPSVYFDKAAGIFEIAGISLPANVLDFFNPVLEWIERYIKDPNENTVLSLRMEYLNTSSAKVMNIIIHKFETILLTGKKVKVCWYYAPNETEMKEMGQDYSVGCKVPFEIKPIEE